MLAKRIIPTVLCRGKMAYKGRQFVSDRSIGSVLSVVQVHARRMVDELVILDVSATAEGRGPDLDLIREITETCFTPVTVGGGVRTLQHIDDLLRAGADKVCIGAATLHEPKLLPSASERFGNQAIVASMDYKDGLVQFHGVSGFARRRMPIRWARYLQSHGAGEILLTSIDRDGMMCGYDPDLIREVSGAVDIPIIASGGCGTYEHMLEAFKAGADACASGAMFAFTDSTPKGAAKFLKAAGLEVRL